LTSFPGFVVAFVYSAGAVVCHQLPERSFALGGRQWPVCARCSGLYLGAALGALAWLLARRTLAARGFESRALVTGLLVAVVPTALSWGSGTLGWWDGTNLIRAMLALPLGLTAGAVVAAVAAKDLR
jgi:uncharacterized membrane protein